MPSPFPGMDPYLEQPAIWPGLHDKLISEIHTTLNPLLLPRFVAQMSQRVYIAEWDDPARQAFIPDVTISRKRKSASQDTSSGNLLTATPRTATQPIQVTIQSSHLEESYLNIVELPSRRVVTVIEVLSPANKNPRSAGFDDYAEKRKAYLSTKINLVEIDLLRTGKRMIRSESSDWDYSIFVRDFHTPRVGTIWPIFMEQVLPSFKVPLSKGESVTLDLQELFDRVYALSGYAEIIDYSKDPNPSLTVSQSRWAKKLLKSHR